MLRKDNVVVTTFICDFCSIESTDGSTRYELDTIQDSNVLLIERPREMRLHTRNYVGTTRINFCCIDCMKKYLYNACNDFVNNLVSPD